MDETTRNYIDALIAREQTKARENFRRSSDALITQFAGAGMALSTNHVMHQAKAAGLAAMGAFENLRAISKERPMPPHYASEAAQAAFALIDEFREILFEFYVSGSCGAELQSRKPNADQNAEIIDRFLHAERENIEQEETIANFERPPLLPPMTPIRADSKAISATIPTGFLKLSKCYSEIVEEIYNEKSGHLKLRTEIDQSLEDADWQLRVEIDFSVTEFMRRSLQSVWQHPELDIWTRSGPGEVPEMLDKDRLANTRSVSWPNSIHGGVLFLGSDPALLPFDRWPLYVRADDWTAYRKTILKFYLPAIPHRKPLARAEFDRWWKGLPDGERTGTQLELEALCKEAFPDHATSRSYIRNVTAGRKPGKRPSRTN